MPAPNALSSMSSKARRPGVFIRLNSFFIIVGLLLAFSIAGLLINVFGLPGLFSSQVLGEWAEIYETGFLFHLAIEQFFRFSFQASWVTVCTGFVIDNGEIEMHLAHFVGLVIVTFIAGVLVIIGHMTGFAGYRAFAAMIEQEIVARELSGSPGQGAVAAGAVDAKLPGMHTGFFVARDALVRLRVSL